MERFYHKFPHRTYDSCETKFRRLHGRGVNTERVLKELPEHVVPTFRNIKEQLPVKTEEAFQAMRALQEWMDKRDPINVSGVVDLHDAKSPVAILPVSCMHLGSRYVNYAAFQEFFDEAFAIPGLYWGSLGDDIEGFLPGFYSGEAVANQLVPIQLQLDLLDDLLDRLSDNHKLLFGTWSEHRGKWLEKVLGYNLLKSLYMKRKVPFFDGIGHLEFLVGEQSYHVIIGHGMPGNSIYNHLHAQARNSRFEFPNADVIINAGKHRYAAGEFSLWVQEAEVGMRKSPFVTLLEVGTAKDGPDKYTIRGWSQGTFEWPMLVLYPDKHLVKHTRHLGDVQLWLSG
jgi:hypothetical protein